MKKVRVLLSIVLSITLLFQSLYVSAASSDPGWMMRNDQDTEGSVILDEQTVNESIKTADVLFELTENRTAYTKEFLLSNGLHMAVAYPDQVHYEKDGKWADIDNTLKLVDSKYTNTEGLFKASLPDKLTDNESIFFEADGHAVSFRLVSASKGDRGVSSIESSDAKVIEKTRDNFDGKLHPERVPEALTSRLAYEKILSGTDLVYDLTPGGIKESIVIETLEDSAETYTFELNTGNLIPRLSDDGSIELFETGSDDPVILLPAPYMVDSTNVYCHDVKVSLEKEEENYRLTYSTPLDWVSSEDRVFPIALDPVVQTAQVRSNINDVTVYEYYYDPSIPYDGVTECGWLSSAGRFRSYVKFTSLPAITASDVVVKAELWLRETTETLPSGPNGTTGYFTEVHKVGSVWDQTTINWSNQPSIDWTVEDTTNYRTNWFYRLEITDIVKDWYSGPNTGLVVTVPKTVEDNHPTGDYRRQFWSADYSVWQTVEKPSAVIYFRNNNGLESYWDYTPMDAGRAGSGYVNNFTGNLVFLHDDLGFSGNRMPVSVSHVYNLNDVTIPNDLNNSNDSGGNTFHMGYGWRTNFNQLLYEWSVTDPNTTVLGSYYIWEDTDGTDHYFRNDNGTYKDEDGRDLTLTLSGTGSEKYCITDRKGNKTYFDTLGRLTKISNNQATVSSITVSYVGSTKEIDTVADGAGRRYVFTYSNGYLSRISYYGTGSTLLTYVDYQYTNGTLTSITDKDGKTVYYTYDQNRLLTSAKDVDGYQLSYTYNTANASYQPYRVLSVEETDESDPLNPVPGGRETFSYRHNETALTDHNNNKIFLQFNDFGNLLCTKDDEGNALFSQYAFNTDKEKDNNTNATKKGNQLRAESALQYTVTNHMKGHSMENGLSYWSSENGATVLRQNTFTHADAYGLQVRNNSTYGGIRSIAYTVPANTTYTFSCYIRPGNNNVYLKAVSGITVYESEKTPTGTAWRRLQVSFPNETNSSQSVQFYVVTEGTDNFFVDAAQLEDSLTANRYNMIEDGDFRYGISSFAGTGGTHTAVTSPAAPQLNANVLKVTGDPLSARSYVQTVKASGSTGDYYTIAGWAKANSAPLYDNRSFSIKGRFHYSDNTWSNPFIASFNPDSNEWQFTATGMIAEKAYTEVEVALTYDYNVNTVSFDGIQLYRDGFGYKYEYDNDNHVISILSPSKEKDEYEYTNNDLTHEILHTGSELTYTYDQYHNVTTATTSEGQVYHFSYDTYGNNTAVSIAAGNETMSSSAAYTSDGNRLDHTTDAKGNSTYYQYNADTNLLEWVKYPNDTDGTNGTEDTRTKYYYNSMYQLCNVAATTDHGTYLETTYEFDGADRLNLLYSNSTEYSFTYGDFSLRTAVSIGNRTLSSYSYSNDRNHYLTGMTYGNGDSVAYTRDSKGRVTEEEYEDNETVTYLYDKDGSLASTFDSESGTTTARGYDYIGRLNTFEKTNSDIEMSLTYEYEENSTRLTSVRDVYNGHARGITYQYDNDKRLTRFSHARGFRYYSYDDFERLSSYETKFKRSDGQWFTTLTTTLDYLSPSAGATTNQVSSIRQQGSNFDDTLTYTYDGNGNVLSVSDGTYTTTYVYDSANELIRENDQKRNYTFTWTYDDAGNILNRKEYPYTTGDLENITPTKTVTYGYADQNWGDLLTSYDGNTITYDAIGNPLSDGTWTYAWRHGRELAEMSDGTDTWEFTYDASGYRTKRTNGDKTYTYAYADGLLRYMEINGTPYYITYAPDGTPMGIVENDTPYYFETNLQGDVIGIVTYGGYRVVKYTYDAWGKVLSVTGSRADTIGKANPIRYRGYVYDQETGFYYLGSRYYSPEMGRWLNPEPNIVYGIFDAGAGLLELNLFAYCADNPVKFIDSSGEFILTAILIGAAVGAVVGGVIGGVITYNSAKESGMDGSSLFWETTFGVLKGGLIGGVLGGLLGGSAGAAAAATAAGSLSISETAIITATANVAARATEVAVLQTNKSYNEGKTGWQVANDCLNATFDNGLTIASPLATKTIFSSASYTGQTLLHLTDLSPRAYFASPGGVVPWFVTAYNWYNTYQSVLAPDPDARAKSRGYTLR